MTEMDKALAGGEAVRLILAALADELDRTESGAGEGEDVAFLHDYRVAVRRARVLVSQCRNYMPADAVALFSAELRWIGQATSLLRDTDIFLLAMEQYLSWLPDELHEHLEPLQNYLLQARKSEQEKFVQTLTDARYTAFIAYWREYADSFDLQEGAALLPFAELAHEKIWKLYKKIIRHGRLIGPDSPSGDLHDLRKQCKKLRYMIEMSARILPAEINPEVTKSLRQLQSVLGEHQDHDVQAATLMDFSKSLINDQNESENTCLALGILIGNLNARKAMQREKFHICFEKLADKRSKRGYRKLFKKHKLRPDTELSASPSPGGERRAGQTF